MCERQIAPVPCTQICMSPAYASTPREAHPSTQHAHGALARAHCARRTSTPRHPQCRTVRRCLTLRQSGRRCRAVCTPWSPSYTRREPCNLVQSFRCCQPLAPAAELLPGACVLAAVPSISSFTPPRGCQVQRRHASMKEPCGIVKPLRIVRQGPEGMSCSMRRWSGCSASSRPSTAPSRSKPVGRPRSTRSPASEPAKRQT